MQSVCYQEIIKRIKTGTYHSYRSKIKNDQLVPNLANMGCKTNTVVKISRKGEYCGLAVKVLENVNPLFTHLQIIKILEMLEAENYYTPQQILNVSSVEEVFAFLNQWLTIATDNYQQEWQTECKYSDQLILTASDPLEVPVQIVEIGQVKETADSVVPIKWIGKTFANAHCLHAAMDLLPNRQGKPPVTYAITYNTIVVPEEIILSEINPADYQTVFYLDFRDNGFHHYRTNKQKSNYQYVIYGDIAIGFCQVAILTPKISNVDNEGVGVYVSRLQKAIRRGRGGSKVLINTIMALNESANYNLPESHFRRVSASRQLVWRLYISILEDCRPYIANHQMSLIDLMLLTLITDKLKEFKFTPPVLNQIILTALIAQYNDKPTDMYHWRQLPLTTTLTITENDHLNAIYLALNHCQMMASDKRMLHLYLSLPMDDLLPMKIPVHLDAKHWLPTLVNNCLPYDKTVNNAIYLSSIDHHCKPHIILYYQACIGLSMTTTEAAAAIWDNSSSHNIRHNLPVIKDPVLVPIQRYLLQPSEKKKKVAITFSPPTLLNQTLTDFEKRICFLILFGETYLFNNQSVIICGNAVNPYKIKIDNQWVYDHCLDVLNHFPTRTIRLTKLKAPFGYQWIYPKVTVCIKNGQPFVNDKAIAYFDGSLVVRSIHPLVTQWVTPLESKWIEQIVNNKEVTFNQLLQLKSTNVASLVNWIPKTVCYSLMKATYTKLQFDWVSIGPVDKHGKKTYAAIDRLREGRLWAVFNLLCYLYPQTIFPKGHLCFRVDKSDSGYIHLIQSLRSVLWNGSIINKPIPVIKTKLWTHQRQSVCQILNNYEGGSFGLGDASDVGSGKTLTALKIASCLIAKQFDHCSGILVLLPSARLITTWIDEIETHTTGFQIVTDITNHFTISTRTLVLCTLAKMRDYPLHHNWLLTIIDECLTVQNAATLWTAEAWRQTMVSKHLLMMSATFFRARFDKLYYMIKMFQSQLPETSTYLDTILSETIVSQISKKKATWQTHTIPLKLRLPSQKIYDQMMSETNDVQIKYAKANSFLTSDETVKQTIANSLANLLCTINGRCLIYAKNNSEAQYWSDYLQVPLYPKKGYHCIVTYANGTFGLNDLIVYDTILTRPPSPDKLPQMKGRLDRPHQKCNHLHLYYFYLANTIEEGLMIRLSMCDYFLKKHIMPLAQFYEISVNYQKY